VGRKRFTMENCPVCVNTFTKVIRQPIQCPYCPFHACRQCTSQYLLTSHANPSCMGCKREWNREFIDIHLTQTFRTGPLRKHRQKCLIDSERARLPSLQIFVEATRTVERASEQLLALSKRRIALKKERAALQGLLADEKVERKDYRTQMRPIINEITSLKQEIGVLTREKWNANEILTGRKAPEARQFIMKCPGEDCRGFLSSAWKCGTCEKNFCADCHVEKKARFDDTHVCNEDAKATAQMIKKETKPCPKCGIRISKIDGCFAKDTPILCWDGKYSKAQDIKVGDVLVGDDGNPRVVEELCSGGDEMFEVTQGKGMSYTVNSKHKLALKFSGEKSIHWSESENAWKVRWFDRSEYCMKSKKTRVDALFNKEKAYATIKAFCDELVFDEVIEMMVDDYMKLPESTKKHLMGFKSSGITWPGKDVPLDPYIMGLWLGDGINDAMSFAINPEADPEILQYLLKWCEENKAELIHDEAYRFRIRRREVDHGRLAIGRGASSSECKGCKEKLCVLCNLPEKPYTDDVEVCLRHPLKEHLEKYDLPRKSKYIPQDYLVNSREVRLQLLAGLIDSDGYVGNDGKRIQIPQHNHTLGKQIEFLARSLGFAVHVDILKKYQIPFPNTVPKDYGEQYRVNISGEHLSEIPTKVARKKCVDSNSTKDELRTGITVKSEGQGTYYGWSVSGPNRRFLLGDFTVARNCDQMWCTGCHTTFSWNTGQAIVNARVHNPHYYEYLRRVHNGVIPREAGDNPCGENHLPDNYNFARFVMDMIPRLEPKEKVQLTNIHRSLMDIEHERIQDYPIEDTRDLTKDLNIRFLMQRLTEEEWGRSLQMVADRKEKKKEVGLILRMLHQVGVEKMRALYQLRTRNTLTIEQYNNNTAATTAAKETLVEMEALRTYTNKSLLTKAVQMNMSVQLLDDGWFWKVFNASEAKHEYAKSAKEETAQSTDAPSSVCSH
jgi:hypothetical protein